VAIVTGSPPVRRRLIGAALRRYRDNIGFPLDTAASILECDRSKISRIETGQRGIRGKELRELLTEYGVPASEQEILLAIAQTGRQRGGWWRAYADVLPEAAQDFILMESCASQALVYEPQRIPELLQTANYAAASVGADPAGGLADDAADRLVEVILTRQEALRERALRLEVVVGEAALHQVVGGADVMRAQLRRLAAVADAPGPVSIQVLPFSAGAQAAAASGPLAVLRFDKAPALGVVHLATLNGGVCETEADEVARYIRAFTQLRAAARTQAASASLLRDMARD
jgi:transcriptional regulator with XRE-family HTH domain